MPIPLGSNRPWAWSFFEILIFILGIYVVLKREYNINSLLESYYSSIALFLAFICIAIFQIIPLPNLLLELLSPASLIVHDSVVSQHSYISVDHGQSIISLIKTLSYFVFHVMLLLLVNSTQRIRYVLITMLASGTFQAVYGVLEILLEFELSLVHGLPVGSVATGSFVYKNHYANFLMLCLCAGVGLIVTSLEKDKYSSPKEFFRTLVKTTLSSKAIFRICLAIMVIGLVMSRSRMGNASFFVSMIISGIIALCLFKKHSRGLSILVVSMLVIDLFILSAYFGLEQVQERLYETSFTQENRDEVLNDSLSIIKDYPILGTGGGTFYSIFPAYQESNVSGFYDHLHNDYVQFVIEYGIVGSLIMLSFLMFSFYKSLRAMRKRRHPTFKGTSYACTMAIFGMSIHTVVDFPLQAYANAAYFIIFLSLAMIINRKDLTAHRPIRN